MNKRFVILLILASILVIGTFTVVRATSQSFVAPSPKQTAEAKQTAIVATVVAGPRAPKYPDLGSTVPEPVSCPVPTPEIIGIVPPTDIQMPFSDHRGIISQANGISPVGNSYLIWAGSPEDNSSQGLIRVMKIFLDPCASHKQGIKNTETTLTDYLAPNGPLTITEIQGAIVVYSIAGGGNGRFNYVAGQFLP